MLHFKRTNVLFCVFQMDTLRSKLEETQADNQKLRFESQMVVTNATQWTSQQKYVHVSRSVVVFAGFLEPPFFSQDVQWERLCPARVTQQSAARCDSREGVGVVLTLATGFTGFAHTDTHTGVVFHSFKRSKWRSCLTTPGVLYLPPTPLQMFLSLLFLPPVLCMFVICSDAVAKTCSITWLWFI